MASCQAPGVRQRRLPSGVATVLRGAEKTLVASARAVDRLPVSPAGLGLCLLRVDSLRRERIVAAASPRWSELNDRLDRDGARGLDELREMWAIEASVAPVGSLSARAHRLRVPSTERLLRALSSAGQRVWRGWSDQDLWSLNQTLCQTLGAQLIALAEQTNGSPGDFAEWQAALEHHGRVLLTMGAAGLTGTDADFRDECEIAVRRSLLWVVDHLGSLWW